MDVEYRVAGSAHLPRLAHRFLLFVLLPRAQPARRLHRGHHAAHGHPGEGRQTTAYLRPPHGAYGATVLVQLTRHLVHQYGAQEVLYQCRCMEQHNTRVDVKYVILGFIFKYADVALTCIYICI